MRTIDVDKLIRGLDRVFKYPNNTYVKICEIRDFLDKTPDNNIHSKWNLADDGDGVVCSNCGEDFCTIVHETERFMYCPHCGAKMDGKS